MNLRARWYNPTHGTFTAFRWHKSESNPQIPYSNHPYAYALSSSVNFKDPSGKCVPYVEEGCIPIWETGQGLNWDDGRAYVENIATTVSDCSAGAFKQWAYNNTFGIAEDAAPTSNESASMHICRHAGNIITVAQGVSEIFVGGAGIGGSGALCIATVGAGCVISVPTAAASSAVAAHGAGVIAAAVWNEVGLWQHISCIENTSSAGSTNNPPRSEGDIIVISDDDYTYLAQDSMYPHDLFAYGKLREDGYISINLQTKGPNGLRNPNFRGATEFDRIINKFGSRAKGVRTTLERDNWNAFTEYMERNPGATIEDGIRSTGAYKRMVGVGFSEIKVVQYVPEYEVLEVIFDRGTP